MMFLAIACFTIYMLSSSATTATIPTPSYNPTSNVNDWSDTDRLSLLAFKSEISLDPREVLSFWNSSLHFCQWPGVTCGHKHNRVTGLHLNSHGLVGKLSPFIGNLSFLRVLRLSNNSLHGGVPSQLGRLRRLQELILTNNSFSGEIPANLSHCSQLTILSLSRNYNLVGNIPVGFGFLSNLMVLGLGQNKLTGSIQVTGNLTSLWLLNLSYNKFTGFIPNSIGKLKNLSKFAVTSNELSGEIPLSLFNISSLTIAYLSYNKFHGHLPDKLGLFVPKLKELVLNSNLLTGQIPSTFSNLSQLSILDFSENKFTGKFWFDGRYTPNLLFVGTSSVTLSNTEECTNDLRFLDTLTDCHLLQNLELGNSCFEGALPQSITNLSTTLKVINLSNNRLYGEIPYELGRYVNLQALILNNNSFSGSIPIEIGRLESLEWITLNNNKFSGEIPSSFGNLSKLSTLYLNGNNFQGPIPSSLGKCQNLLSLRLSENNLTGVVPLELLSAMDIAQLGLDKNHLHGSLPFEISNLKNLRVLNLSMNNFSGLIPTSIGECSDLEYLNLKGNSLSGPIPQSLSSLKTISYLDLSYNQISGQIPSSLSNLSFLTTVSLSFNNLEGQVPVSGAFSDASVVSLDGNNRLCGGIPELHLPSCPSARRSLSHTVIIITSFGLLATILSVLFIIYFVFKRKRMIDINPNSKNNRPLTNISYQMLMNATNGFSHVNLIGQGGFGLVYKGMIHEHDSEIEVAIKVINLQYHGALKSFMAECETLKNVRHRNLVKIISVCSSIDFQGNDFKALIYQFMPKGSLETWLYSNKSADIQEEGHFDLYQRLLIAIDIACALDYLHNHGRDPITHCDLKPSNILLDNDMVAHISDFGLAKFQGLPNEQNSCSIGFRGTIGYAPPEYGLGSEISREGDVYSFGILILEMMTSKRPTDSMFGEGLDLRSFARSGMLGQIKDIVDSRILSDSTEMRSEGVHIEDERIEAIKSIVQIGIKCSAEMPKERMTIKDAINGLNKIRKSILGIKAMEKSVKLKFLH